MLTDYQLPVIKAGTPIERSFSPMIENKVSGIVVDVGRHNYRLFHYSELETALEAKVVRLEDLAGGIEVKLVKKHTEPEEDVRLAGFIRKKPYSRAAARAMGVGERLRGKLAQPFALLRSSNEGQLLYYVAVSPGYSCSGPAHHTYPPFRRGASNHCVVTGCPGTI